MFGHFETNPYGHGFAQAYVTRSVGHVVVRSCLLQCRRSFYCLAMFVTKSVSCFNVWVCL